MRIYNFFILTLLLALTAGACSSSTPSPAIEPTFTPIQVPTNAPIVVPSETPPGSVIEVTPTALPEGVTNILTVHLREGIQWSDGTPLTSKDIVGTYDIYWAQQFPIWEYLADVVIVDDYTIDFLISTPSPRVLYLVLRSLQIAPYSQYGQWMNRAAKLRVQQSDPEGTEVENFLKDLYAFAPTDTVVYGPYKLDTTSVTTSQLVLAKNPTGYNAGQIDFDQVVVHYGETNAIMPYILNCQIDYATHAFTPTEVKAITGSNCPYQILRAPTFSGPALWFNESVSPLDKKEMRQALAYAIKRADVAKVALGASGMPIQYMAGFPDEAVSQWLTPDVIAKLNPYNTDLQKAEDLLIGLGFKKEENGQWVDAEGKLLEFEVSVRSDYQDWLAAAQNVVEQLNTFGIKTTLRTFDQGELNKIRNEGQYQILVNLGFQYTFPHPWRSFNSYMTAPANNPEDEKAKGMNWPQTQTGPNGQEVNILELLAKSIEDFDPELQKPYVATLAQIYNEQLPVLMLFERYTTDPIDTQTRITGWRPFTDTLYLNSQAGDNYSAIQMLDGTLAASNATDKTFYTAWPYPQPYNLNFFTDNSLPTSLGSVVNNLEYPPLFWYMWSTQTYVPVIAEKFELK